MISELQQHGVYNSIANVDLVWKIGVCNSTRLQNPTFISIISHNWRSPEVSGSSCKTSSEQCCQSLDTLISFLRSFHGFISHRGGAGVLNSGVEVELTSASRSNKVSKFIYRG